MQFNVLNEPWIDVKYKDGQFEKVGLRDLYKDAHKISRIVDEPYRVAALHRFLSAFTTDMLCLKDEEAWFGTYDDGSFDMDRFDKYVSQCKSEGVTFDLFDKERPFLVQTYDPEIDGTDTAESETDPEGEEKESTDNKKTCHVSSLYLAIDRPSGNNTMHRVHTLESAFEGFTPAETLINIITLFAYPTASRLPGKIDRDLFSGSPYGSFGLLGQSTPPAFFVPLGGEETDLFTAMMHGAVAEDSLPALNVTSLNDVPAAWRDPEPLRKHDDSKRGERITKLSYVSAVFMAVRRIVLDEPVGGLVKTIWYSNGKIFHPDFKTNWRDPFIAYQIKKKKDGEEYLDPVTLTVDKACWRELGAITAQKADSKHLTPWILEHSPAENPPAITKVLVVSLNPKNQKAGYDALLGAEVNLPTILLNDPLHGDVLKESLAVLEDIMNGDRIGKLIKETVDFHGNKVFERDDPKKVKDAYIRYMSPTYWYEAHKAVFNQLIPQLSEIGDLTSEDIKRIKCDFSERINRRENYEHPELNGVLANALRALRMSTVFGNEYENEKYWMFRGQFEFNSNIALQKYRGDSAKKKKKKEGGTA